MPEGSKLGLFPVRLKEITSEVFFSFWNILFCDVVLVSLLDLYVGMFCGYSSFYNASVWF